MDKENKILYEEIDSEEELNFDDLEKTLQSKFEENILDLETLREEFEQIGNPDVLGETIKNVIWEQFLNQIAVTAGEDFIEANRGLTLDLRNEAHIQTAENFTEGKIATHNYISKEQLVDNYDRYKNMPHKEFREKYVNPGMNATLKRAGELKKKGIDTVTDIYTGRQIPTETKLENGKNNPKGSQREHVKSSDKLYKDSSLQMAYGNEELAEIINNPENLQGYTTAERNNRKSNNSSDEMSAKDKNKHWEKANKRAEEYIEQSKNKGEERLKQEGFATKKEETLRMKDTTHRALKTVAMLLLAEFLKEIIGKLILWFKNKRRSLGSLIDSIKVAIISFAAKWKVHMANATNVLVTTIATAIIGPVVGTIKKVWMMLKQGFKAVKEAIVFLRNPNNKNMPFGIKILEVGKIVMAGVSGAGAIILGEAIEKGLMSIPGFAVEIPLIGSLANIIGIFMGAVVAGIIGALVIYMIDKSIDKERKGIILENRVEKANEVLRTQQELMKLTDAQLDHVKAHTIVDIKTRHEQVASYMKEVMEEIDQDDEIFSNNKDSNNETNERLDFDSLDNLLDGLFE